MPQQPELPMFDDHGATASAVCDPSTETDAPRSGSETRSPTRTAAPDTAGLAPVASAAQTEALPGEAVPEVETGPALLDQTIIGAVVLRELDRALALYPMWAHPFAGLAFNRARRCYGQAHRDGRMVLSTVFIGTAALEDLEDTVRHELAHLIVGVEERHGPRWRAVARKLGAVPRATGRSRSQDLSERMDDAPWTLVAILGSGEERELKPAFRRNRRLMDYRLSAGQQRYRCAGQDVLRFEYRRRGPC